MGKKEIRSLTYDPLRTIIVHGVFTLNILKESKTFNNKEISFLMVKYFLLSIRWCFEHFNKFDL